MDESNKVLELENRIKELEALINTLSNATEISPDVIKTLQDKLGVNISVSSKDLDSEDVTVNEAGAASYAVMGDPDGFLSINGKFVPYFN